MHASLHANSKKWPFAGAAAVLALATALAIPAVARAAAASNENGEVAITLPGTTGNPGNGPFTAGYNLYSDHCASCHQTGDGRTPQLRLIRDMTPAAVYTTLTQGVMRGQGEALSMDEKIAVSEFVTNRKMVDGGKSAELTLCDSGRAGFDADNPPPFANWGLSSGGSHFIPTEIAGLDRENVGNLKLKWAYAFADSLRMRSQPAIAGGSIILGNHTGSVRALDLETGCVRWNFEADAEVRTAVIVSPWKAGDTSAQPIAYFGDLRSNVYALDARTGKQIWKIAADDHPAAVITAAPSLHNGTLYVPVSSIEEAAAASPGYACCSFRGSVIALDASTGEEKWRTYMVGQPKPTKQNRTSLGPSGVAIWNSPTIDEKRGQLYFATGDNYSNPATHLSDSIVALDLSTGKINWHFQALEGDAWNVGCVTPTKENCPDNQGPDFDFGVGTVLAQGKDNRELLLAGQKSGIAYGLDPDSGQLLWQTRAGRGGEAGGIVFGLAAANGHLFVPMFDKGGDPNSAFPASPGLYALDIATGEFIWRAPAEDVCNGRKGCSTGMAGSVTATPELVLAGSEDGHIRIHDAATGAILWDKDTAGRFATVNGVPGHGGSISGGAAPLAYRGKLIVASGYGYAGRMAGNVLLVFETR